MNLELKIFVKLKWTLCYRIFTSQNFKHTSCEGAKRTTPVITKKGKYGTRKEVTTTSPLGMCGEKKCVLKRLNDVILKPLKLLFSCLFSMAYFVGGQIKQ